MKHLLMTRSLPLVAVAILSLAMFSSCEKGKGGSGQGYTGKLEDSNAISLAARCHFIPKEQIVEWTKRYNESRLRKGREGGQDSAVQAEQPAPNFLTAGVASFNSCIIRKLINDSNSIGLRALMGLDEKNVVHIIFVGVSKDYKDLYVDETAECCSGNASGKSKDGVMGVRSGGAEYGQIP